MDPSLKIDLNRIKQVVLDIVKADRSTTTDLLLHVLKSNYPNVNDVHLRYKLSKVMRELKDENVIREVEKRRIDFGQNIHNWAHNICLIDLNIIRCLKILDRILREM